MIAASEAGEGMATRGVVEERHSRRRERSMTGVEMIDDNTNRGRREGKGGGNNSATLVSCTG